MPRIDATSCFQLNQIPQQVTDVVTNHCKSKKTPAAPILLGNTVTLSL